jgi:hypothetical protein
VTPAAHWLTAHHADTLRSLHQPEWKKPFSRSHHSFFARSDNDSATTVDWPAAELPCVPVPVEQSFIAFIPSLAPQHFLYEHTGATSFSSL